MVTNTGYREPSRTLVSYVDYEMWNWNMEYICTVDVKERTKYLFLRLLALHRPLISYSKLKTALRDASYLKDSTTNRLKNHLMLLQINISTLWMIISKFNDNGQIWLFLDTRFCCYDIRYSTKYPIIINWLLENRSECIKKEFLR